MAEHIEKDEQAYIEELQAAIKTAITETTVKVLHSAWGHIQKKGWITSENPPELQHFLTHSLPQAMTKEITEKMDQILYLEEAPHENQ